MLGNGKQLETSAYLAVSDASEWRPLGNNYIIRTGGGVLLVICEEQGGEPTYGHAHKFVLVRPVRTLC